MLPRVLGASTLTAAAVAVTIAVTFAPPVLASNPQAQSAAPTRSAGAAPNYTTQQWSGTIEFRSIDRTGTNGLPETTVEWAGTLGSAAPNPYGMHVASGSYTYFNYDNYLCPTT